MRTGRPPENPSVDDAEAVALLCERLAGGMSMVEACADKACPTDTAVYRKMAVDADFAATIARAREAQQHFMIDETVRMADEATLENWQVVKLRIWARQWRAGKLAAKTYGDKVRNEIGGLDGESIQVNVRLVG